MEYQPEKFFFIQTLFHIDSTLQINHQYLNLDQNNSLDLVMDNCENIDFFSQSPKGQDTSQLRQIQDISQLSIEKLKPKKQRCHCKKTRCLKMYCECFSQGISCTKDCVCIGCNNDQKNQRNKSPKRKNAEKTISQNVGQFTQLRSATKGCNCKKSHCEKKYCECQNAGLKCGEACLCVECKNCVLGADEKQKYKSSSGIEKNSEQVTEQENFQEQQVRTIPQMAKKEELVFIVMSNELLAQIDGYLTA